MKKYVVLMLMLISSFTLVGCIGITPSMVSNKTNVKWFSDSDEIELSFEILEDGIQFGGYGIMVINSDTYNVYCYFILVSKQELHIVFLEEGELIEEEDNLFDMVDIIFEYDGIKAGMFSVEQDVVSCTYLESKMDADVFTDLEFLLYREDLS